MNLSKKLGIGLLVLGLVAPAMAVNKKKSKGAPAMDPAMEQMMRLGSPGENHKVLEPLVGKWTSVVRGWMKPGDKPEESQGTSENLWIYGGRYLKQDFKGSWAGQPFEGTGYTAYDNVRGEYESLWLDNFSTGLMQASGSYDAANKILKVGGSFSCPMTGEKSKWFRSEWKIVDADNNTYTSYFMGPDGKEFKSMEIIFTRVK